MRYGIDFPRDIPAPPVGATTMFDALSALGQRSMELQGHRVASTPELTKRVAALEDAHAHAADHMTACGLDVGNLRAEVSIILEHKQQQIDALTDQVEALRRMLVKVA